MRTRNTIAAVYVVFVLVALAAFGWLAYLNVRVPPLFRERFEAAQLCNALSERYPKILFQEGHVAAGRIVVRVAARPGVAAPLGEGERREIRGSALGEAARLGVRSEVVVSFSEGESAAEVPRPQEGKIGH
jgi:hypothetical protein